MRRGMGRALLLLLAVATGVLLVGHGVAGCGNLDEYYKRTLLSRHSRGSAIDISEDDSRVVVVNRDPGTVTVFPVSYAGGVAKLGESTRIPKVCADAPPPDDAGEPWQVVIHPNGDTAYVVCRSAQVVVEIVGLRSTPRIDRRVSVGSEPTGIALTPLGAHLWVANWMDGTLQRVRTADMTVEPDKEIDLNKELVAAGYLGKIDSRPALAHPRSIAISNDGDDDEDDETMVVTEYFSQENLDRATIEPENPDTWRVGLVYKVALGTHRVTPIPLRSTTFEARADDKTTRRKGGCFPNQLQSVTINGKDDAAGRFFAYVTSICASPGGALAIETMATPAITVVDLRNNVTVKSGTIPLNSILTNRDDPDRQKGRDPRLRLPLLTNDLAFLPSYDPDRYPAVVTAGGADAVFRMRFDPVYEGSPVTIEDEAFVDLTGAADPSYGPPIGPIGVAMAHSGPIAFTANDGSRTVAVVDVKVSTEKGANRLLGFSQSAALPAQEERGAADGKRLFNFGLGKWSRDGRGWGACSECHIDGLSDGITWSFPRGPRQTISIDTFFQDSEAGKRSAQRQFGWNAQFDEVTDLDAAVIRRFFGGDGLLLKNEEAHEQIDLTAHGGLNGSSEALVASSVVKDWDPLIAFMKRIRTPFPPSRLDQQQVLAGRALAEQLNCGGCHGDADWTISRRFYVPGADGGAEAGIVNELLKDAGWPATPDETKAILPGDSSEGRLRYAGPNPSLFDSVTCVLREVGTYGRVESDVRVLEVRENGSTAQGSGSSTKTEDREPKGYNPPSLIGLAVGAPYFHAGNARTLEGALGDAFATHRRSLAPAAPTTMTSDELKALVTFLLAIDRRADKGFRPLAVPTAFGANGGRLCPTKFPK